MSNNVTSDLLFYSTLYTRIEQAAKVEMEEDEIMDILMYVEDCANLGLCEEYAHSYSSLANLPLLILREAGVADNDISEVMRIVDDAVEKAPEGTVTEWVRKCVESGEFMQLKELAMWLHNHHPVMKRLHRFVDVRMDVYYPIYGSNMNVLLQFVDSDYAFNWKDKNGNLGLSGLVSPFGPGDAAEFEILDRVLSVEPLSLDEYKVENKKGESVVTLRNINGDVFEDVEFHTPIMRDIKKEKCICMLVGYNGHWYLNGPALWVDMKCAEFQGASLYNGLVKTMERSEAEEIFYVDAEGEEHNLCDDMFNDEDWDDDDDLIDDDMFNDDDWDDDDDLLDDDDWDDDDWDDDIDKEMLEELSKIPPHELMKKLNEVLSSEEGKNMLEELMKKEFGDDDAEE